MKKLLAVFFGLVLVACGNSQQNNPDVSKKVPKGLVASSGARTVELSWNGVSGATGYTVYWTNNPNLSPLSGEAAATELPYYLHTSLQNGMTYYYVVTATLASGETGPSNMALGYPKADVPAAPSVFSALPGDRRVTLSFDVVPGATKYAVYWSNQPGSDVNGFKIENIQSPFVHSGLDNNKTYYYTLRAENDRGESDASIELTARPRMNPPTAPQMLEPTPVAGQVTLTWVSESNASDYKLFWGRNPGVSASDAYINHVSSPFVHAPISSQAGEHYYYRVQAGNAGGVSALSNEVEIITPDQFQVGDAGVLPPAPVNVVTAIQSHQITLDWQVGAGSESLGYNIYWLKGDANIAPGTVIDKTAANVSVIRNVKAPYTHIGLENGTYYYYRIAAINNAGESALSTTVYAAPQLVKFGVPAGLSAFSGDQQLSLTWIPVDGAQGYEVQLDNQTPIITGETRFLYTNLVNYQSYTLKVRVRGAANDEWSNSISATPRDPVPNPPRDVIAVSQNKQAQIRWQAATPVNVGDSNENIVDYVVYMGTSDSLTPENGKQVALVKSSGAAQEQAAITNLSNGTRYYFVVTARNVGGESLVSNLAWTIPQTPIPNAPSDLAAVAGNNQVTLSFTPLSAGNVTYNLYWNKETVSGRSPTQVIVNIANNYVFTDGQANGIVYYFRVAAVSAGGESVLSSEVSAKPQVPAPQTAPQNFSASAKDAQVSLSWDPVAGATAYELFWSTGNVDVTTSPSVRFPGSVVSYEHLGVKNGSTYFYLIRAVNPGGSGPVSNVVNAYPQVDRPQVPQAFVALSGDGSVSFNWATAADAGGYELYWTDNISDPIANISNWRKIPGVLPGFVHDGLINAQAYKYSLKAINPGGASDPAAEQIATPQLAAPAKPLGISAAADNQSVSINWYSETGLIYTLYWSTGDPSTNDPLTAGNVIDNATPIYVLASLTNNVQYNFQVVAHNAGPNASLASNIVSTTPQPPQSGAPTALSAEAGDSEVTLRWNSPAGAASTTQYTLYWSDTSAGLSGLNNANAIRNVSSPYVHSGRANGQTYYYVVTATETNAVEGPPSNMASAKPVPPLPAAPASIVLLPGNGQITITWTSVTGAAGYLLQWSYSGAFDEGLSTTVTAPATQYIHTGLSNGVAVSYRISSQNISGTSASSTIVNGIPVSNQPPLNHAPVASNVLISDDNGGVLILGTTLYVNYTYSDAENDAEGQTQIQWYRASSAISGATQNSYTLTRSDVGQAISVDVTPLAVTGFSPGQTQRASVTSANTPPRALNVAIIDQNGGSIVVGDTLNGQYTYSDLENDSEGNTSFLWLRDSSPVTSAVSRSYTVVAADSGHQLTFQVRPRAVSGDTQGAVVESAPISVSNSVPTAANVQISDINGNGIAVGDQLVASYVYNDVDGDVEGASTYQWLRGNTLIAGANGLSYTVASADSGQSLVFSVTPVAASGATPGLPVTTSVMIGNSAPVASGVTINDLNGGDLRVGDSLRIAYVYSDSDGDAEGVSRFQWLRNGSPIANANGLNYVVVVADSGASISASVTPVAASGASTGIAVTSLALTVLNSVPSVSNVQIIDSNGGAVVVGDLLQGSYTYFDVDNDSEGQSLFQWFRNGSPINGATGSSYVLTTQDSGQTIRFDVTPIAASGANPGLAVSASLSVGNTAPVASNVTISGIALVGNTLTASYVYGDIDNDAEGTSLFQWYRGTTAISSAITVNYTIVAADSGQSLRFQVIPVAVTGTSPGIGSSSSITVQNSAPLASNVNIAGTPSVGSTLVGAYSYSDVDGDVEGASAYQWFRGSTAISAATSTSYTVVSADSGQTLRFQVTPVAASGVSPGVAASAIVNIQNSVPVASSVAILGTPSVGNTLTGAYVYSDADGDAEGVSTFQWYRGSAAIAGAVAATYGIVSADSGQTLRFEVTPVAASGASPGIAVSATLSIQNSPPSATNVAIAGNPTVGNTLTGSYTYSDIDGDVEGATSFQWFRGTTAISGATASSYTVVAADSGQTLRFEVTPRAQTGVLSGAATATTIIIQNSAPTASNVAIAGSATVGNTLTGSYTYIDVDGDLEGATSFQWYRGAAAISGANATTYVVVAADSGLSLRFEVTPVALTGVSPGAPVSASITGLNTAPVASNVSIGGNPVVGATLTGSYSYSDVDGDVEAVSTFQWYRGATAITGANAISYTVVGADSGQTLRFQVTPVAATGTSPGAVTSATIVIQNSAPTASNVAITGTAVVASTLTATYTFNDVDGDAQGASTYQWFRGANAINGATALTYTTVAADSGQTLRFQVVPVAATGVSPGVAVSATIIVQNSPPLASNVSVAGTLVVGSTLTGSYVYSDVDGDTEGLSGFQWYRGAAAIPGATAATYVVVAADSGQSLRFQVTPVATTGVSPGVAVFASVSIQNSAPTATTVAISGSPVVGSTLTASYTYADVDGDAEGTSLFQWYRGTSAIPGAVAKTYVIVAADSGQSLRFEVIPVAAAGTSPGIAASATITIQNSAPTATNVSIAGNARVGSILTGAYVYNDLDGDAEGASTFQWFRGTTTITGANAKTYTVVAADSGQTLRFEVVPVAATGVSPGVAASATLTIQNSSPVASNVSITGIAAVGNTLTGHYSFTDVDGDVEGTTTFQWYRGATLISGATAITYNPVAADSNQILRFEVTPVALTGVSPGIAVSATITIQNSVPQANNVAISGNAVVGSTLTGAYNFSDPDGDVEGVSIFQWYRGSSAISGAVSKTYVVVAADSGQILRFEVTPVAATGASPGSPNSATVTIQNSIPQATNVVVNGTPNVNSVLNATYAFSDPDGDVEGVSTFQWYRGSTAISGATSLQYTVQAGDAAQSISFAVTPQAATGANPGLTVFSTAVTINSPPLASNVTITGSTTIGSILTGGYAFSDVDGDSEGVSTFQWFRGSAAISGAVARTYTIVTADSGQTLRFQVTPVAANGSNPGLAVSATISILNSPPTVTQVTISGTPNINATLTGGYSYSDIDGDLEGASLLQWYSGTTLLGSGSQYTIKSADAGQSIRFEVTPIAATGANPGAMVTSGQLLVNSPPVISALSIVNGTRIGSPVFYLQDTLSASYSFSDVNGDVENGSTFAWYRDGVLIPGIVNRTYTIQLADVGHSFRVDVTPGAFTGSSPGATVSSPSITVTNQAPGGVVSIVDNNGGLLQVGDVLHANFSYLDPENDPAGTPIYQWYKNASPISGATAVDYTVATTDQSASISVGVIPVATIGTLQGSEILSTALTVSAGTLTSNFLATGTGYLFNVDGTTGQTTRLSGAGLAGFKDIRYATYDYVKKRMYAVNQLQPSGIVADKYNSQLLEIDPIAGTTNIISFDNRWRQSTGIAVDSTKGLIYVLLSGGDLMSYEIATKNWLLLFNVGLLSLDDLVINKVGDTLYSVDRYSSTATGTLVAISITNKNMSTIGIIDGSGVFPQISTVNAKLAYDYAQDRLLATTIYTGVLAFNNQDSLLQIDVNSAQATELGIFDRPNSFAPTGFPAFAYDQLSAGNSKLYYIQNVGNSSQTMVQIMLPDFGGLKIQQVGVYLQYTSLFAYDKNAGSSGLVYTIDKSSGTATSFEPVNNTITNLGHVSINRNGSPISSNNILAMSVDNDSLNPGFLYVIIQNNGVIELVTLDESTFKEVSATVISGISPSTHTIYDMAYHAGFGKLYALTYAYPNTYVWDINPVSGAAVSTQVLGIFGTPYGIGVAEIQGAAGTNYSLFLESSNGSIYSLAIDPVSTAAVTAAPFPDAANQWKIPTLIGFYNLDFIGANLLAFSDGYIKTFDINSQVELSKVAFTYSAYGAPLDMAMRNSVAIPTASMFSVSEGAGLSSDLYITDTLTGLIKYLGNIGVPIKRIAYDRTADILYGVEANGSVIYPINFNGSEPFAQPINYYTLALANDAIQDIAIDENQNLYVLTTKSSNTLSASRLLKVDLSAAPILNQAPAQLGYSEPFTLPNLSFQSMDYNAVNSRLLIRMRQDYANAKLLSLDPASGVLDTINEFSDELFGPKAGIAFDEASQTLYQWPAYSINESKPIFSHLEVMQIGNPATTSNSHLAPCFDSTTNTLLLVESNGNNIVRVDVNTATTQLAGHMVYNSPVFLLQDTSQTPPKYYGYQNQASGGVAADLFSYDLQTGLVKLENGAIPTRMLDASLDPSDASRSIIYMTDTTNLYTLNKLNLNQGVNSTLPFALPSLANHTIYGVSAISIDNSGQMYGMLKTNYGRSGSDEYYLVKVDKASASVTMLPNPVPIGFKFQEIPLTYNTTTSEFYSIESSNGQLISIDPVSGIGTVVGAMAANIDFLTFDSTQAALYGVARDTLAYPDVNYSYKINTTNGNTTFYSGPFFGSDLGFGNDPITLPAVGLAYNYAVTIPQFYGIDREASPNLIYYDGASTVSSRIGALNIDNNPAFQFRGLALNSSSGVLFGLCTDPSDPRTRLFSISDVTTATGQVINNANDLGIGLNDLKYVAKDNVFVALSNNSSLVVIDPNTGALLNSVSLAADAPTLHAIVPIP